MKPIIISLLFIIAGITLQAQQKQLTRLAAIFKQSNGAVLLSNGITKTFTNIAFQADKVVVSCNMKTADSTWVQTVTYTNINWNSISDIDFKMSDDEQHELLYIGFDQPLYTTKITGTKGDVAITDERYMEVALSRKNYKKAAKLLKQLKTKASANNSKGADTN